MMRDIREAIAGQKVCPGGVLAVGYRDRGPEVVAFGKTGAEDGAAVTADTLYDVASLTKPMATFAVTMKLISAGKLALDDRLDAHVPALGHRLPVVTIAHVLGHAAGFPAHRKLFEEIAGSDRPRARLFELACAVPLEAAPGERAVYSDIGFILLGAACEDAGGERLDVLAERLVFAPLAMTATRFVDLLAAARPDIAAAPTYYVGGRPIGGRVHDDNARSGGGILGHAGLFSTAPDVARFCAALCTLAAGEAVGGFDPDLARTLFATAAAPGTTWRLGLDTPAADRTTSHAGTLWPQTGLGHLGFTGCSLWIEPVSGAYAVLLTNRVLFDSPPAAIRAFRAQIMDAAWRHLAAG